MTPDAIYTSAWIIAWVVVSLILIAALYKTSWLRQRGGHKTPDQIRAEQKGLGTDAATEFKLVA